MSGHNGHLRTPEPPIPITRTRTHAIRVNGKGCPNLSATPKCTEWLYFNSSRSRPHLCSSASAYASFRGAMREDPLTFTGPSQPWQCSGGNTARPSLQATAEIGQQSVNPRFACTWTRERTQPTDRRPGATASGFPNALPMSVTPTRQ